MRWKVRLWLHFCTAVRSKGKDNTDYPFPRWLWLIFNWPELYLMTILTCKQVTNTCFCWMPQKIRFMLIVKKRRMAIWWTSYNFSKIIISAKKFKIYLSWLCVPHDHTTINGHPETAIWWSIHITMYMVGLPPMRPLGNRKRMKKLSLLFLTEQCPLSEMKFLNCFLCKQR